jgi:L-fuconolactonase
LQPDFVRGVQLVAEYGFSFDICIRHYQLPMIVELVRQCPDTRFMLDHLGKPAIKDHLLDPWREHLAQLAALPSAWCKVSGLVTEADPRRWTPDDLAPSLAYALEVFGEDRVVFGGDWPVLLLASSYDQWIETLDALTRHLSP